MEQSRWVSSRTWSWATDAEQVAERRHHADGLVGEVIAAVSYVTIDYFRETDAPETIGTGPRDALEGPERMESTWSYQGFDAIDYGIDLVTASGAVWSMTWDPPGDMEGVGLRSEQLIGSAVAPDADVAIWDVSEHEPWRHLLGQPVREVVLHYYEYAVGDPARWCPRITLGIGDAQVEVLLGDVEQSRLVPSSSNLAVVRSAVDLPRWAL